MEKFIAQNVGEVSNKKIVKKISALVWITVVPTDVSKEVSILNRLLFNAFNV